MKRQIFALAAAAGMALSLGGMSSAGAASAVGGAQQWAASDELYCFGPDDCWPIAFRHYVYSDETMSNLIGFGEDSCNGGSFVTSPSLPAGYAVKERAFVCAGSGPYLPMDW